MVYLWEEAECPMKHVLEYDYPNSPDRFEYRNGLSLKSDMLQIVPHFISSLNTSQVLKYDAVPNNAACPVVNQKVVDILTEICPDSFQLISTQIHCKEGVLTNYFLLVVTRLVTGIDMEHSIGSYIDMIEEPIGFKYCVYKPDCMGQEALARSKDYLGHILVNETIKQAFIEHKIKGPSIIRYEDYYGRP